MAQQNSSSGSLAKSIKTAGKPVDHNDIKATLLHQPIRSSMKQDAGAPEELSATSDIQAVVDAYTAESEPREQQKILKKLATVTPEDKAMHKRQKHGQLRFGDVICISYHQDVFEGSKKKEEDYKKAVATLHDFVSVKTEEKSAFELKKRRNLDLPDSVYRGLLYSDGVTDRGIKIIPQENENAQNAGNLFKQCLFRIEIMQDCTINKSLDKLKEILEHQEADMKKYSGDGKDPATINHQMMTKLKKDLDETYKKINEKTKQKKTQEENNTYEMNYRLGNKITYGTPIQLRHLFSDKYLTLNLNEMSQDYGCCEMFLSETSDFSIFSMEPSKQVTENSGYVVNFNDYFHIKSWVSSTPFYMHVFQKPNDEFTKQQSFSLNASQEPTLLKAKLYMSFGDKQRAKAYIQNGDVIRFKHVEADGYLTTKSIEVDALLPALPDFLKGQLRRMNKNQPIERPKGGIEKALLSEQEVAFLRHDAEFEYAIVDDQYVKQLKLKTTETIFIEENSDRLQFTNSCWEIQRVSPLQGGNIIIDEIVRFRHVGTGKYLSLADDRTELVLKNSSNSLACLFILKSDMSNKKQTKYRDDDGDGIIDNYMFLESKQRVMVMSYLAENKEKRKYLQLLEETDIQEKKMFEHKPKHVDDAFRTGDQAKESQFRIINHHFQKTEKQRMIFYIEEVQFEEAIYSYQSSCIFDELLEFYAFLNVWAVSYVEAEEPVERYYYKPKRAIDLSDELFDKIQKMMFILTNLQHRIQEVEHDHDKLDKCKSELSEQGILDIICRCIEMIYYKTTPPSMFQRSFKSSKGQGNMASNDKKDDEGQPIGSAQVDLHKIRIDEYVAQEIARDHLDIVAMRLLELVLALARGHRKNSEKLTKYYGIFYQWFQVQQDYFRLTQINANFVASNPGIFQTIIGEIFVRSQKNAMYVFQDRSNNALVEFNKIPGNLKSGQSMSQIVNNQIRLKAARKGQLMMGINSRIATDNIERSTFPNQVQKWLDLLEPVRFIDSKNQNLEQQIMILNVISMHCREKSGNGVYPYQMQVIQNIFEREENIPVRFGTAKVGNTLRPFVYFVRPKKEMSLAEFVDNNPILGEIQDNFNMQQKHQNQYELIFDMHELTKNYEKKGKETWPYIEYICAVLNLYAHMCLSANQKAIKKVQEIGLNESHILLCIHPDNDKLIIHEKFKQVYMLLTRCMYINNDPISPGIGIKNRCYVWERLKPKSQEDYDKQIEQYDMDVDDAANCVENDFYAGAAQKRLYQMDDPNNSMIVLRHEQESKDLSLIRMIKTSITWFLQEGPQGTDSFFYHHNKRKFLPKSLKLKIKSLKVYLDTIHSLISEDCVDEQFIEDVKMICQCALMGSTHFDSDMEERLPFMVKANWVYILMWIAKDITLSGKSDRRIENAIRAIECKVLNIFDTITSHRLNLQVLYFLQLFRKFQETNLDPHVSNQKSFQLEEEFQQLFKIHQFDAETTFQDKYIQQKKAELQRHADKCKGSAVENCLAVRAMEEFKDGNGKAASRYRIPFDLIFMNYIFQNNTNIDVRRLALQVFIKNFNQRDLLVKELVRTDIIVSELDHQQYVNFLGKQRQLKQLTNKLVQDEMYHMIYKKSPSAETRNTKVDIQNILNNLISELQSQDPVNLRKFQNMIRHINLIDDLLNVLLKRLIFKEFYYKELFQTVVNFFFQCCYNNPNCQNYMLKDLNFFLDLMNNRIETGLLISEIIKSNSDENYRQNFATYLVNKIVDEGYFKSTIFHQLIKLAENHVPPDQEDDKETNQINLKPSYDHENSMQQFIMKKIIKNQRFRSLIFMKREFTQRKLGIIKTYAKKREQYNLSKKEIDASLQQDKENLDLHMAVIDLLAVCARNSPFGIAQAQKLIECEELLDSLLSDAIPYLVKKHYFNLLFEVYLRKVPGLDDSHRLSVSDIKFAQILKWVVYYDLDHSYNYFNGLVIDGTPQDTPEIQRKLRQVNREIERASEAEYDDKNYGKTEKDKEDERKFKAQLSSFKDTQAFYVLDTNDKAEFWKYLFEYNVIERREDGLLLFIRNFFRDYRVDELADENIQEITVKIRERMLGMANKIFQFIDTHGVYIKENTKDMLHHLNAAVQKIPHQRAFRVGKKRVIKDGLVQEIDDEQANEQDESLNVDESRDVDNRMSGDKVMRLLRDHIIKENLHIRDALGINCITSDYMIPRETLKDAMKKITLGQASYDEIMKALDHFHQVSLDRKQEKNVMNVEPGQQGYTMNIIEGQVDVDEEIRTGMINFKDVEVQLKDVLKKAGYKAPNQQRDRGGGENEVLVAEINDKELSIAINMDMKLFTQRFFEFVHLTKTFSEIHDFVHKLLKDSYIKDKTAKAQLIENLLSGFVGLQGDDDELVLIQILNLILQNKVIDNDDAFGSDNITIASRKKLNKKKKKLKAELREWQEVMFTAKVPELMISFINVGSNQFLANKALCLLNSLLIESTDENQHKILALLKKDQNFFQVFYYIKERLRISKNYLIERIQKSALKKFKNKYNDKQGENLPASKDPDPTKQPNDLRDQKIYISKKYDLEYKYEELKQNWKQDEMNELLKFLNSLCENCYKPAQLFLKSQLADDDKDFRDKQRGKITSIDLIYEVVSTFIDIIDQIGDYVFSDFRTFKLVPLMLDTMIEFIYGPCIANQEFLGGWKKLIMVINTLMNQQEMGNYSGIHQEAKAQLAILYSCSQALLAICDIKDRAVAKKTHDIILNEVDIQNLVTKMVDIYIYKIGGNEHKKQIYCFNHLCNHYEKASGQSGEINCIKDEFCEKQQFIPRDLDTIQTGFNIYQILKILERVQPNHPKLKAFKGDQAKYKYLLSSKLTFERDIFKQLAITSENTNQLYQRFNKSEAYLLDQLIIDCFPETYQEYLDKLATEARAAGKKLSPLMIQAMNEARTTTSKLDKQQILERIHQELQEKVDAENDDQAGDEEHVDSQGKEDDNAKLLPRPNGGAEDAQSTKETRIQKVMNMIKLWTRMGNESKVHNEESGAKSYLQMSSEERIEKTTFDRAKFLEELRMYKQYLASNFYEDNIGSVEVVTPEGEVIETTFKIPSYVQHLTKFTREVIPRCAVKVSQQEKMEKFVETVEVLKIEMQWQQQLGRISPALKYYANNWENLSWLNFILILIINLMLMLFMDLQDKEVTISTAWQNYLLKGVGLVQTVTAGVVMTAYYIEYRATLKQRINRENTQSKETLVDYGQNYGSQGYGERKSGKFSKQIKAGALVDQLGTMSKATILSKGVFIVGKEALQFTRALWLDMLMVRNTGYFILSLWSNYDSGKIVNAFLLVDIIFKIQSLTNIMLILKENWQTLLATFSFLLVVLYIFAFYAFGSFRDTYGHLEPGADSDEQDHAPDNNMYCETLARCFLSTLNYGVRAGGGIGDVLDQPMWNDDIFWARYGFDFLFFMLVNIILLNILFGIIIDSFADKRQQDAEILAEITGQCFICGISKSVFEIENRPWNAHIFVEHNLHTYLAFIIYVENKQKSECTGIEKWVKDNRDRGTIDFFPINRCKYIRNGEKLDS